MLKDTYHLASKRGRPKRNPDIGWLSFETRREFVHFFLVKHLGWEALGTKKRTVAWVIDGTEIVWLLDEQTVRQSRPFKKTIPYAHAVFYALNGCEALLAGTYGAGFRAPCDD